MTDMEAKLRHGLRALTMASPEASPPPVGSIVARASARPPSGRPWAKIAIGTAAGLGLTAGVAGAAGVLPGPVESTLREFRSWGFAANQGAERMAWVTDGDMTYELWRAPLDGGGLCVYDRVIAPTGDVDHGGSSHCGISSEQPVGEFANLGYPERMFDNSSGRDPQSARLHDLSYGQAPLDATTVVFEFDDGTTLDVPLQREGFFITTFPGIEDGRKIAEVRALDAAGNVLATG